MKAYRLEYKNGFGVYHFDPTDKRHDARPFIGDQEDDFETHPAPQDDKLLCTNIKEMFADIPLGAVLRSAVYCFDSIEQFYNWFIDDKALQGLATLEDLYVTEHEALSLVRGQHQSIFSNMEHLLVPPVRRWHLKDFLTQFPRPANCVHSIKPKVKTNIEDTMLVHE
jgi:hypothetical protein